MKSQNDSPLSQIGCGAMLLLFLSMVGMGFYVNVILIMAGMMLFALLLKAVFTIDRAEPYQDIKDQYKRSKSKDRRQPWEIREERLKPVKRDVLRVSTNIKTGLVNPDLAMKLYEKGINKLIKQNLYLESEKKQSLQEFYKEVMIFNEYTSIEDVDERDRPEGYEEWADF